MKTQIKTIHEYRMPLSTLRNNPILKKNFGNFEFLSDKKEIPDENDYHIATDANFEEITEEDFNAINAEIYESKSHSKYKVKNGIVYRISSHWGKVASCRWTINYQQDHRGVRFGKVALKDMKRNDFAIIEKTIKN